MSKQGIKRRREETDSIAQFFKMPSVASHESDSPNFTIVEYSEVYDSANAC